MAKMAIFSPEEQDKVLRLRDGEMGENPKSCPLEAGSGRWSGLGDASLFSQFPFGGCGILRVIVLFIKYVPDT
jgi:hypothetical protein